MRFDSPNAVTPLDSRPYWRKKKPMSLAVAEVCSVCVGLAMLLQAVGMGLCGCAVGFFVFASLAAAAFTIFSFLITFQFGEWLTDVPRLCLRL